METYVTFNELELLIRGDLKQNVPVALFSRPGTGKSSFLKDLADSVSGTIKGKVFTIAVNQIADKADLTGVRLVDFINDEGKKDYQQEAFPHATIMEAIQYAEQNPEELSVVFLDEFNRTTQDVTSATLSFTTERKIGTREFPDNIRFVLAGNKKGNVVPFDDATATRFAIYNVRPDHLTFLDVNPNLNQFVKEMIIDNKGYLLGEAEATTSTNSQPNPYAQNQSTASGDEDGDELDSFDPFMEDSGITEERTVPRTLVMISEWLNGESIDKSGSSDEMNALHEFTQVSEDSQNNRQQTTLLQIAIESKIGKTGTALELVNRILEHYDELNKQANASVTAGGQTMTSDLKDILDEISPSEEMIEELQEIQSRSELSELVDEMDSSTLSNTLLWLLTNEAYKTLDGMVTPVDVLEEVAAQSEKFDKRNARIFNMLLGYPDFIVKRSISTLKEHTPASNTDLLTIVSFAETMMD